MGFAWKIGHDSDHKPSGGIPMIVTSAVLHLVAFMAIVYFFLLSGTLPVAEDKRGAVSLSAKMTIVITWEVAKLFVKMPIYINRFAKSWAC